MWPFTRKDATPQGQKSAAFLLGMGQGKGTLTGAGFTQLSTEGYGQNAVVNACINKIANAIASIDRRLYQKKGSKLVLLETHPLLDLLDKPNPTQSGDEFTRALIAYRQIGGNAYIRGAGINYLSKKSKPPTELTLLNPGQVKVEPSKDSYFPKWFEFKPDASTVYTYPVEKISGRSEILQLKTFNPLNPWYGLPPMLAAAYGIDINNASQKWNKKQLDNDCRPSGALTVKAADGKPAMITDDQYQRLQEMIDNTFSGSNNAGKPLLLEGGLEWQQMSMTAKDMDFMEAMNTSARNIGLVFGVPPQILGIPGSQTFANYEQANLSFWTDTVLPLNELLLDAYNRWLIPFYGDDLVLKYDHDSIDALEPIRKQKADRIKEANYMQIGEKRKAMGHDSLKNKEINDSLLLDGRGILLGMDGQVISLAGAPVTPPEPTADPMAAAKHQEWLESQGYTKERAERLTKLIYAE